MENTSLAPSVANQMLLSIVCIMEVNVAPAISIKVRSQVQCVEFSPFEWSRGLLAVGLPTSVAVFTVKLKEEGNGSEDEYEQVWEWHASSQPVSIAWSPTSTLRTAPSCLQVSVASADHKVRQISSDLGDTNVVQVSKWFIMLLFV